VTSTQRIAFLGLGRMGTAMAAHIARADYDLTVWNRSSGKAEPLLALGAHEAPSVEDAVADADVVVLMLFDADSVRDVLGPLTAAARPGTLVLDSTTIGPAAAREFGATCAGVDLRYVDAPVAGTVKPAIDGTLGVLAGGSEADFEAARPLLELWGAPEKVRRIGPIGTGNAMKLVINLTLGVAIEGLGEALRLAEDLELDEQVACAVISAGPLGWTLVAKGDLITARDASTPAFSLEALTKDLRLALDVAQRPLPATATAEHTADIAIRAGHGGDDHAALAISLLRPKS
jgi:3-hydroxyisobutyrate dehydrogenase